MTDCDRRRPPQLVLLLLLATAAAVALTSSPTQAGAEDLAEDDKDLIGVITGVKASYMRGPIGDHAGNLGGVGAFGEVALIPHWVEAELSAKVLFGHDVALPVELLFKKPFHLPNGHIFVGAGPAASIPLSGDGSMHFGAAASLGVLEWLTPTFGLIGELNYTAFGGSHVAHEAGVSVGMAYHL